MIKSGLFNPAANKMAQALRYRLQLLASSLLFPVGKGDWYALKGYGKTHPGDKPTVENSFNDFATKQKKLGAKYYEEFQNLDLSLNMVASRLVNGNPCKIEVMTAAPQQSAQTMQKPGNGKHIIYFPGANTYYQACFRDISTAAKETGAMVHAFNFPGTGASTGRVLEANDLVNSGIAVINKLLSQGVHPDNIILQGDCYGAGIALEVKKQFDRSDIKLRIIMNNTFKSFKAVVCSLIPNVGALKAFIKQLLVFSGWNITPGKNYNQSGPYQCYIQHEGDQTLGNLTLAKKAEKYQKEIATQQSSSKKRPAIVDTCPEEYKKDRDLLNKESYVRVKEEAKEGLKKFGVDQNGNVNAHFADLCECETATGESTYTGYVNKYLIASDKYIANHPQEQPNILPKFLRSASFKMPSKTEQGQMAMLGDLIQENCSQARNDNSYKSVIAA